MIHPRLRRPVMKRLPDVAILLVAVALIAADKGEKKKKVDAEKIQGNWIVVEAYRKGKKDGDQLGKFVTFSGKKMTLRLGRGGKRTFENVFELRPYKKPRELDMIFKVSGGEKTFEAIYELTGDTLKICFPEPGKGRPRMMGTAAGDERSVLVFKRVKGNEK